MTVITMSRNELTRLRVLIDVAALRSIQYLEYLNNVAGIVLGVGRILGLLAWLRLFMKVAYLNS